MAFTINKDLIYIDSMQFINCSLEKTSEKFIRQRFKIFN